MEVKENINSVLPQFVNVDLSEFFEKNEAGHSQNEPTIVVFTHDEQALIDRLEYLLEGKEDALTKLHGRIDRLQQLGAAIARYPSLLERHSLTMGERTPEALIDSLITYQEDGDTMLHLPSKAQLGKGLLVAKIHALDAFYRLSKDFCKEESLCASLRNATVSITFLLLAEDVYLNLIKDKKLAVNFRRQLALSLLLLWEHRSDQNIKDIAPVLQQVWQARRTLAPAFGTMVGTSEMLLMSMQMGNAWVQFMKERLSDEEVSNAMSEFLFGLSYEQIIKLKDILKQKNIAAIGRDEVSKYLGQRVKTDISLDYRDFYLLYTVRRDNARARSRLMIKGPHKTLEDYFIGFVMQKDSDKQSAEIYAQPNSLE